MNRWIYIVFLAFNPAVTILSHENLGTIKIRKNEMEFSIMRTWNNLTIDHDPIVLKLHKRPGTQTFGIEIIAPHFYDPAPPGPPKKNFPGLWDYEVVELFFLGTEHRYLELEFSPHGQYLSLLLKGPGNAIKQYLPINYDVVKVEGADHWWRGIAIIPFEYLPPNMEYFNAYAIHGTEPDRKYEALFPTPHGRYDKPNFHRLEYFRAVNLTSVLTVRQNPSLTWCKAEAEAEGDSAALHCYSLLEEI